MSNSFTNGTLGFTDGSALGSAGLMFHSIKNESGTAQEVPQTKPCLPNEVRYSTTSECFVPNQLHINILVFESVILGLQVLFVLLYFVFKNQKDKNATS
jgi:hypothetical protein